METLTNVKVVMHQH